MCHAVRSAVDCAVNENCLNTIRTIYIPIQGHTLTYTVIGIPRWRSSSKTIVQSEEKFRTKFYRLTDCQSLYESLHRFYCFRVSNARYLCNRLMSPERFYALSFSIRPTKYVSPRPRYYAKRLATVT